MENFIKQLIISNDNQKSKLLKSKLKNNKNKQMLLFCEAYELFLLKDYKKSLSLVKDCNGFEHFYIKGLTLYDMNNYKDAEICFFQMIEINKNSSIPYNNLGNLYSVLNKFNEAEMYYKLSIDKDNNFHVPYLNLGILYNNNKLYEEAIRYYKLSINIYSEDPFTYNNLAVTYTRISNFIEAEINFKLSIGKDDSFISAYLNLGNLYFRMDRYFEAETYYKKGLEKNPKFISLNNNLGNLYKRIKRYDDAEKCYKLSIQNDDQNIKYYRNLMRLYILTNKKDKKYVEKFIAIVGENISEEDEYIIDKLNKNLTPKNDIIAEKFQIEKTITETEQDLTSGFVIFIDLCNSTEFKLKMPNEWFERLIHFYKATELFLYKSLDQFKDSVYLLKYIGDEIMFYIEDTNKLNLKSNPQFLRGLINFLDGIRDNLNSQYFLSCKHGVLEDNNSVKETISYEFHDEKIDLKLCISYVENVKKYRFNDKFDILGSPVDFTARLMSLCKQNMIVCNSDLAFLFQNTNYQNKFKNLGRFDLKGINSAFNKNQNVYIYDYNNLLNFVNEEYIKRNSKLFDEIVGRFLLLDKNIIRSTE